MRTVRAWVRILPTTSTRADGRSAAPLPAPVRAVDAFFVAGFFAFPGDAFLTERLAEAFLRALVRVFFAIF